MGNIPCDGTTAAWWLPTITLPSAPTVAEFGTGINLTTRLTRDGLIGFKGETGAADTTPIGSRTATQTPSELTYSNMRLRIMKVTGTDTLYTTLTLDTAGFVVIRRSMASATAVAATQTVQVFPVICGLKSWLESERNTVERWEVPTFLSGDVYIDAAVAA